MLVAVPPILTFYLNIVHFPTQYVWPSKINARAKVWSPKTWGSKKSKFFGGGSLFNMNSYNIPPIYYTSSIKKYEYSKNPKTKILDVNLVPWLAARMTPSFPSRNRFPPAMSRVRPCICISRSTSEPNCCFHFFGIFPCFQMSYRNAWRSGQNCFSKYSLI